MVPVGRALAAFADRDGWLALIENALRQDFSWRASAHKYLALYEELQHEQRSGQLEHAHA